MYSVKLIEDETRITSTMLGWNKILKDAKIITLEFVWQDSQSRIISRLRVNLYNYPIWFKESIPLCFPSILWWKPAYCSEVKVQRMKASHRCQANESNPFEVPFMSLSVISFLLSLSLSFRRSIYLNINSNSSNQIVAELWWKKTMPEYFQFIIRAKKEAPATTLQGPSKGVLSTESVALSWRRQLLLPQAFLCLRTALFTLRTIPHSSELGVTDICIPPISLSAGDFSHGLQYVWSRRYLSAWTLLWCGILVNLHVGMSLLIHCVSWLCKV